MKCELGKKTDIINKTCEDTCSTCKNYKVEFDEKGLVQSSDRDYVDNIICPYCGDETYFEGEDCSGEYKCYGCDKTFYVEIEYSVSITTTTDCNYNNEKHQWEEWKYFDHRPKDDTYGRKHECKKCDEIHHEFNVEKKPMDNKTEES